MNSRFELNAERRIGSCRDIDNMIRYDGGNDRLDISLKFDAVNHPEFSVHATLLVNKETGFAELWVFDRKVWTETEAYS